MRFASPQATVADSMAISSFFASVYKWMALAMLVTAGVAWQAAASPAFIGALANGSGLLWLLIIAQLGLVVALAGWAHRMSHGVAVAVFLGYAALTGLTFSTIFLVYTSASIAKAFVVTAGMFAAMSLYGYTTKKDLSVWGSFLFMSLIGIIIGSFVNIWLRSPLIEWMVSYGGVVIFAGLAAYDHQKLKAYALMDSDGTANLAVRGALTLYLDFINLFLSLLRIMGDRR